MAEKVQRTGHICSNEHVLFPVGAAHRNISQISVRCTSKLDRFSNFYKYYAALPLSVHNESISFSTNITRYCRYTSGTNYVVEKVQSSGHICSNEHVLFPVGASHRNISQISVRCTSKLDHISNFYKYYAALLLSVRNELISIFYKYYATLPLSGRNELSGREGAAHRSYL
jgi:hypothetical protein